MLFSWDQLCEGIKPKSLINEEVTTLRLKTPSGIRMILYLPFWWMFVTYHLIRSDFDIIHAFDIDSILPAIFVGKIRRKPVIYEMIDICEYELVLPKEIMDLVVKVDKIFMSTANAVIVVDEMQAVGLGGVPNPRTLTLYDSPPTELLTDIGLRDKKDKKFTLFYVGMFYKSKRLHLGKVVDAIKDLDDIKLIIAGYGDMIEVVQEWAFKMPNKVEFIGRISYADVFKVGKNVDLMFVLRDPIVLANKYTCGSTFLSAMMLGVPVLANKGTSTAVKVLKDNCGLVVDSRNAQDIQKAIMTLQNNPDLQRDLRINARRAYCEKYSWDLMEKRLLALYRELLKE